VVATATGLGVFGGDATVEDELHLLLLRRVCHSGGPAHLDSLPQEPDDRCPLAVAQLVGLGRVGDPDDRLDGWPGKLESTAGEVALEVGAVMAPGAGVGHMPPVSRRIGLVRRVIGLRSALRGEPAVTSEAREAAAGGLTAGARSANCERSTRRTSQPGVRLGSGFLQGAGQSWRASSATSGG
jgi:hypothetical protein